MNLTDLRSLVQQGEGECLELKKTTGQLGPASKTICGFLNGRGGYVLFGVRSDHWLEGQTVSERTLEDVSRELEKLEPPAFPEIELVPVDREKQVIVIHVRGGEGPFSYDGRPYVRVGATTKIMPQREYERRLLERMHASKRWENQPASGIGIHDLDESEIIRTVEEAIRRQRLEDPGTRDIRELLNGFGLGHGDDMLNAAVVLFGRTERLLPNYPQCALRLARFRGVDQSEFIDNRQVQGNGFTLFQAAQRFLREHLPVAGRVIPNVFERVDDPLYPTAALREALANALCHRDYSVPGGAVSIAIYDDRLEIANAGSFPFDITEDVLLGPHPSRPWNPLIAQAFYRRGIIEAWGRGTQKIGELLEAASLSPPEFIANRGEVLVRMRHVRELVHLRREAAHVAEQDDVQVAGQVTVQVAARILEYCTEPRKASEIREFVGLKHRGHFQSSYLQPIQEKGWLAMTIPDRPRSRNQRYRLTKEGAQWLAEHAE